MKTVILIFASFCLAILSCCAQKKKELKKVADSTLINQQVRKILYPKDSVRLGKEQFLKKVASLIDLPTIDIGKEGIYVRIWAWGFEENYIINISKNSDDYNCRILAFEILRQDSTGTNYLSILSEWQNVNPKSGWDTFIKKMNQYQIPFLESGKIQHQQQLPGRTSSAYIQFEIAKPNEYRFYEYLEPSYYRYIDTSSKAVYNFLEYINKEMSIQVYKPAKHLFLKPN
jgi:hypothetical protein